MAHWRRIIAQSAASSPTSAPKRTWRAKSHRTSPYSLTTSKAAACRLKKQGWPRGALTAAWSRQNRHIATSALRCGSNKPCRTWAMACAH